MNTRSDICRQNKDNTGKIQVLDQLPLFTFSLFQQKYLKTGWEWIQWNRGLLKQQYSLIANQITLARPCPGHQNEWIMSGEGALQKLCCTLPHVTLWLICCIVSHCDVAARLSADCYASKKHHKSKICKALKLQICDCSNSEQCNGKQTPSDTHLTSSVCCR